MPRRIPLAVVALAVAILGFAAQPASACWNCQQMLLCDMGFQHCQLFAICTLVTGPCVGCATDCQNAPGTCNRDPNALCQWTRNVPSEQPFGNQSDQKASWLRCLLT